MSSLQSSTLLTYLEFWLAKESNLCQVVTGDCQHETEQSISEGLRIDWRRGLLQDWFAKNHCWSWVWGYCIKKVKKYNKLFFHLMQCHLRKWILKLTPPCCALCPAGAARQLRRISTWSHQTRRNTSRSWRRTTTAWERAWGPCWRGRFLSSINPSSGLGWRTGKHGHQVKRPILLWQRRLRWKWNTYHWSFHHYDCWTQSKVTTNGFERAIHSHCQCHL